MTAATDSSRGGEGCLITAPGIEGLEAWRAPYQGSTGSRPGTSRLQSLPRAEAGDHMPTGPWGCHSSSAKAAGSCAVGSGGGRECWEREPAQCDLAGVRVVRGGKAGLREGPSCLTPEETLHHMALWLYRVRCVRYRKNNKNDRHCSTQHHFSAPSQLPVIMPTLQVRKLRPTEVQDMPSRAHAW